MNCFRLKQRVCFELWNAHMLGLDTLLLVVEFDQMWTDTYYELHWIELLKCNSYMYLCFLIDFLMHGMFGGLWIVMKVSQ